MTHATQTRPVEDKAGLVVANFGQRVIVEDQNKDRHRCMLRGRNLRPVCGDRVRWTAHRQGNIVIRVEPRHNTLARPDRRGRKEILAANLDQLVVVVAPRPAPDPFITDRYLAAAELMPARAVLVLNKIDLDGDFDRVWIDELAALDYPLVETSAKTGTGLDQLALECADKLSIFAGVSGVGKSSLLNALAPDLDLKTATISKASGEGRHTTTASVLHHLPAGGSVIDSPGVRDYAPPPIEPGEVADGYREMRERAGQCRFNNCLHWREPDCAIRMAVEDGEISERRYASYRRLMNLMRQLQERRQK